ncbi:hypothetical protein V5799_028401, partial [Amblyomma americanum]
MEGEAVEFEDGQGSAVSERKLAKAAYDRECRRSKQELEAQASRDDQRERRKRGSGVRHEGNTQDSVGDQQLPKGDAGCAPIYMEGHTPSSQDGKPCVDDGQQQLVPPKQPSSRYVDKEHGQHTGASLPRRNEQDASEPHSCSQELNVIEEAALFLAYCQHGEKNEEGRVPDATSRKRRRLPSAVQGLGAENKGAERRHLRSAGRPTTAHSTEQLNASRKLRPRA